MRKLLSRVEINHETYQPTLVLTLDGKDTGVSIDLTASGVMKELNNKDLEADMIKTIVENLHIHENLTPEEKEHFTQNLKTLVTPAV